MCPCDFDVLAELLPNALQAEARAGLGQSLEAVLGSIVQSKYTLPTARGTRHVALDYVQLGRNHILIKLLELAKSFPDDANAQAVLAAYELVPTKSYSTKQLRAHTNAHCGTACV